MLVLLKVGGDTKDVSNYRTFLVHSRQSKLKTKLRMKHDDGSAHGMDGVF